MYEYKYIFYNLLIHSQINLLVLVAFEINWNYF